MPFEFLDFRTEREQQRRLELEADRALERADGIHQRGSEDDPTFFNAWQTDPLLTREELAVACVRGELREFADISGWPFVLDQLAQVLIDEADSISGANNALDDAARMILATAELLRPTQEGK